MLEQSRARTRPGARHFIVLAAAALLGVATGATNAPTTSAPPAVEYQAGPNDDTLDHIDCIIRRMMGLPCIHDIYPEDPAEPQDPPAEPEEPITRARA